MGKSKVAQIYTSLLKKRGYHSLPRTKQEPSYTDWNFSLKPYSLFEAIVSVSNVDLRYLLQTQGFAGKRQVQVKKEMISKQIGVGTKQDAKSEQPEIVIFGKEASLPPQKKSKNVPQESMNPSKEPKGGESEVLTSKENPGSSKQTLNIESNKGGSKLSNKTGKISTGQTQAKKDSKDSKAKKTEKPRSDTPATVELDKNPAQKANPKHSKSKLGQTSGAEKKDSLSKKHKSKISNIQKKSSGKVVKNKPKIMGISVAKSKGKSVGKFLSLMSQLHFKCFSNHSR